MIALGIPIPGLLIDLGFRTLCCLNDLSLQLCGQSPLIIFCLGTGIPTPSKIQDNLLNWIINVNIIKPDFRRKLNRQNVCNMKVQLAFCKKPQSQVASTMSMMHNTSMTRFSGTFYSSRFIKYRYNYTSFSPKRIGAQAIFGGEGEVKVLQGRCP